MKKVLIIVNTNKEASKNLSIEISEYLKTKDIKSTFFNFDGFADNIPIQGFDFVVTLGGDGTVLYAARNCVNQDIPVFPINLGQFGFMSSVQQNEWKNELDLFLNGNAEYQERMMIQTELVRNNQVVMKSLALNDVVVNAKYAANTIAMVVNHCDKLLCKLKADGLIVSTPTGSTAYSASAGGPIVDPLLEAMVLTPVNAFSLSSRPIVLNPKGILEIAIQPSRTEEICMIVDGQKPVNLQPNDLIKISCLNKKIKLISCNQLKYYNALRSKLNWRGEPHA